MTSSQALDADMGAPKEHEPAMAFSRLFVEGYFGLPCPDPSWPSLEHVSTEHGSSKIVIWLSTVMVPSAGGYVDPNEISLIHEADLLHDGDAEKLRRAVAMANLAWQQVHQQAELQKRCDASLEAVNRQAGDMVLKLSAKHREGGMNELTMCKKIQATQNWRASKVVDIHDQLAGKDYAVREAINAALMPMFSAWAMVDAALEQRLRGSGDAPMESESESEINSVMAELDNGLETLSLEATL